MDKVSALRTQLMIASAREGLLALEKGWNRDQKRYPKGSKMGGKFAPTDGGDGGDVDEPKVPPHAFFTPNSIQHPHDDDKGYPVFIRKPTQDGNPSAWPHPLAIATVRPSGHAPEKLNGVAFTSFHPGKDYDWEAETKPALEDHLPDLDVPGSSRPAAGVIVEEPDGRIWLTRPTNSFGGYQHTFPKGTQEPGMSLQATAIKETWEETGLHVELTGVLGDFKRTTSTARYYLAKRIGGTPADMGWESQAIRLVPRQKLHDLLNMPVDHDIVDMLDEEDDIHKGSNTAPTLASLISDAFPPSPLDVLAERMARISKSAGFEESEHPRWPKGTPLGGQFKGTDEHGLLTPPKIGSEKNPEYTAKAGAIHGLLKHGDLKNAEAANALLQAKAEKIKAKIAGGAKPHSHDKWNLQLAQYSEGAIDHYKASHGLAVKADKVAEKVSGHPSLASYKKTGAKPGGSNPGGLYEKDGSKYLVKGSNGALDPDRAKNEVLASKLLQATGAGAPDQHVVDLNGEHGGGLGVASKWIDGGKSLDLKNAAHINAAREDFAAHAWLGNYDVVGLSHDNIHIVDGKAVNIDPGGALLYRAQGAKKYADGKLPHSVIEWDSLRGKTAGAPANPAAWSVFGGMTQSQLKESAEKLKGMTDEKIGSLVDTYGPGDAAGKSDLTKALIARRDDILKKAGVGAAYSDTPDVKHMAAGESLIKPQKNQVGSEGPHHAIYGFGPGDAPNDSHFTAMGNSPTVANAHMIGVDHATSLHEKGDIGGLKAYLASVTTGNAITSKGIEAQKVKIAYAQSLIADLEAKKAAVPTGASLDVSGVDDAQVAAAAQIAYHNAHEAIAAGDHQKAIKFVDKLGGISDNHASKFDGEHPGSKQLFAAHGEVKAKLDQSIHDALIAPHEPAPASAEHRFGPGNGPKESDFIGDAVASHMGIASQAQAMHASGDLTGLKEQLKDHAILAASGHANDASKHNQAVHAAHTKALISDLEGGASTTPASAANPHGFKGDAKNIAAHISSAEKIGKLAEAGDAKNLANVKEAMDLIGAKYVEKGDEIGAHNSAIISRIAQKHIDDLSNKSSAAAPEITPPTFSGKSADFWNKQAAKIADEHAAGLHPDDLTKPYVPVSGKMSANAAKLHTYHAAVSADLAAKHAAIAPEAPAFTHEEATQSIQPTPNAPLPGAKNENLPAMPDFDAHKLGESNTNASSHNPKIDKIKQLAGHGDVKGIIAMKYGTNTYAKKQVQVANDALKALGSEHVVTAGQKAGSHPALVAAGVTAAHAEAYVGPTGPAIDGSTNWLKLNPGEEIVRSGSMFGVKYAKIKVPAAGFNASNIPVPPDFEKTGSQGPTKTWVSSKPEVNAANNKAVQSIYDKALQNDLHGVESIKVPLADGTLVPVAQHKAGGVKEYHTQVASELKAQTAPTYKTVQSGSFAAAYSDVAKGLAEHSPAKAYSEFKGHAEKAADYLVLSKGAGSAVPVPQEGQFKEIKPGMKAHDDFKKASDASYAKLTAAEKSAAKSYTGSAFANWNEALRTGSTGTKAFEAAQPLVKAFDKAAVPLPAGSVLWRGIDVGHDTYKSVTGALIQDGSFQSSSYGATPAFSGRKTWLKIHTGENVKAIHATSFSAFGTGEREVILANNTRYLVMKTEKHDNFKDSNGNSHGPKTIVHVLALPHE